MRNSDIPEYTDPDSFSLLGDAAKFPCSTEIMRYDPLLHRYVLTARGMEHYGISADESGMSPDMFADEVSEDVYGVMSHLAPFNYRYNCWLVAQSSSLQFPDKYTARKQFEKALVYQARYKLKNMDVRDINGIDIENGNSIYFKQLRKELRHFSAKALDILQTLGLLYNGRIPHSRFVDYTEGM